MKPQEFIDTLFFDLPDDEVVYTGTKWEHIPGLLDRPGLGRSRQSLYTNLCTFRSTNEAGLIDRVDSNVAYMYAVLLDDIGSKYPVPELPPTCVIESSKGNFQYLYFLEQPVPLDEAKQFMLRMKSRDVALGDEGSFTVNRLIRLPCGVNGKPGDGAQFKVTGRWNSVHEDAPMYVLEDLISSWSLPEVRERTGRDMASYETGLPAGDYTEAGDPVLSWLSSRNEVYSDDGTWVQIRCPWADSHTDGNTAAGYRPLGRGSMPDHRGFNCFHEHCVDQKTVDFLEWVHENGGPRSNVFDPVAPLVSRYVLLEYSTEVADTWAAANAPYPIVSLSAFRAAHKQFIAGPRGGKEYYGDLWLEHDDTVRCKGRIYEPEKPAIIAIDSVDYFNTYRPIKHPVVDDGRVIDLVRPFQEHMEWLVPDRDELLLFYKWVAQKLQQPRSRSFGMVLVAALAEGEEGERYGTGRSTVGDILGRVFQSGVAKVDLEDITGKGDSQSAYNDWADGTQLVIIEEAKAEASDWRVDHASYERLKTVIDTRPIPNVRVKPKYGRIYETTVYCNFLFFTNHADMVQLPRDDRRICALSCAKGRRSFDEYAALQTFLRDDLSIGALYEWFLSIDVSDFDHVYPPMTPAKERMARQSKTSLDEVWDEGVNLLDADVCTMNQLMNACMMAADDDAMSGKIKAMVRARWRKMDLPYDGCRVLVGDRKVRPRILRNHATVRLSHGERGNEWIGEIISRNLRYGV